MRMYSVSSGGLLLILGPPPVLFLARNICDEGGAFLPATEDLELLGLSRGDEGSCSSEDISITLLGSAASYLAYKQ